MATGFHPVKTFFPSFVRSSLCRSKGSLHKQPFPRRSSPWGFQARLCFSCIVRHLLDCSKECSPDAKSSNKTDQFPVPPMTANNLITLLLDNISFWELRQVSEVMVFIIQWLVLTRRFAASAFSLGCWLFQSNTSPSSGSQGFIIQT